MEVKHNVRQRRLDRIRELKDKQEMHYYFPEDDRDPIIVDREYGRAPYPSGHDSNRYDGGYMPGMDDPEFVWKRKWERELRQDSGSMRDREGPLFKPPTKGQIRVKIVLSVAIFAVLWAMFRYELPGAGQARSYIATALSQSYDFSKLAALYNRYLGESTTLLPAIQSIRGEDAQKVNADLTRHYFSPLQGKILSPFEPSRIGITVQAKEGTPVFALDTGRVIYSGSKEDTGYTVIIQHADGLQSTYGWLEQPRVNVNDWIKGGETVGSIGKGKGSSAGMLFFSVSRHNKFVNPTDVVPFD